jgi:dipeptidase
MQLLRQQRGGLDTTGAFSILRAHGVASPESWRPDHGLLGAEVCMHAGAGPVRGSQSVGSLVARLAPDQVTAWVTGTAAPCTSIFKPVWIDAGLPEQNPAPQGTYDPHSWWWQHELLHRAILDDYAARVAVITQEQNALETSFVAGELASRSLPAADRRALTRHCFDTAAQAERNWLEKVNHQPVQHSPAFYQRLAWAGYNRQANIDNSIPAPQR